MKKVISLFLIVAFGLNGAVTPTAMAQPLELPQPGTMIVLSPAFTPAVLKGMVIHPHDPFKFDFIVNRGDVQLNPSQKQEEYTKLIKYFLAALAVPDEEQWVNLSPYEKNRIIPKTFGLTEMGRDLLSEDYMLKQITASMIYPEDALGRKFWKRIYEEATKRYGTTNIPVNTFNKVWIIPDKATVYEKGDTVYILENHLKVMLEEDYLSLTKHSSPRPINALGSQIVREVLLPALEKEVNEGKNFAPLRQVYSGMLLATWYKRTLKTSILGKLYANQGKVKGIDQNPRNNIQIYDQYLKAFKKGVFNMIKEDTDRLTNQKIPRKYFSGGMHGFDKDTQINHSQAMTTQAKSEGAQKDDLVAVLVQQPVEVASIAERPNSAMKALTSEEIIGSVKRWVPERDLVRRAFSREKFIEAGIPGDELTIALNKLIASGLVEGSAGTGVYLNKKYSEIINDVRKILNEQGGEPLFEDVDKVLQSRYDSNLRTIDFSNGRSLRIHQHTGSEVNRMFVFVEFNDPVSPVIPNGQQISTYQKFIDFIVEKMKFHDLVIEQEAMGKPWAGILDDLTNNLAPDPESKLDQIPVEIWHSITANVLTSATNLPIREEEKQPASRILKFNNNGTEYEVLISFKENASIAGLQVYRVRVIDTAKKDRSLDDLLLVGNDFLTRDAHTVLADVRDGFRDAAMANKLNRRKWWAVFMSTFVISTGGLSWYLLSPDEKSEVNYNGKIDEPFGIITFLSLSSGPAKKEQGVSRFFVKPEYFSGKREDIQSFLEKNQENIPNYNYMMAAIQQLGFEKAVTSLPNDRAGYFVFDVKFFSDRVHPKGPYQEAPPSSTPIDGRRPQVAQNSSNFTNAAMSSNTIRTLAFVLGTFLSPHSSLGQSLNVRPSVVRLSNEVSMIVRPQKNEVRYTFKINGKPAEFKKGYEGFIKSQARYLGSKEVRNALIKASRNPDKAKAYTDDHGFTILRILIPKEPARESTSDKAQVLNPGGIDMNAANLAMIIKRDGNGMPLPISQQDLDNIHLNGLVPRILSISSAASLPIFSQ